MPVPALLADEPTGGTMFLGDDLLPWLLIAFGAAMAVGTGLALVRPRYNPDGEEIERPPLARSLVFIGIGALAAVWGLASLFT